MMKTTKISDKIKKYSKEKKYDDEIKKATIELN